MAAALVANQSLTEPTPDATIPVQIDDLTISCALRLPVIELSLREAYAFACPLPFENLAQQLAAQSVSSALELLHLNAPPTLENYPVQPQPPASIVLQEDALKKDALGQGQMPVTPLQMAVMAAAVVDDGNAPE